MIAMAVCVLLTVLAVAVSRLSPVGEGNAVRGAAGQRSVQTLEWETLELLGDDYEASNDSSNVSCRENCSNDEDDEDDELMTLYEPQRPLRNLGNVPSTLTRYVSPDPVDHTRSARLPVAFLLRGAVGRWEMKLDRVVLDGKQKGLSYVDYRACHRSIQKFIFEPNEGTYQFDVFMHSWSQDLADELIAMYHPRAAVFEDNTRYKRLFDMLIRQWNYRWWGTYGLLSWALSGKKVIDLALEEGVPYEYFVINRFDVLIWKPMVLAKYDKEKVYVCGAPRHDFHFVMNRSNARGFRQLFDAHEKGLAPEMHLSHMEYIERWMKVPYVGDDIMPGRDIETFRKSFECVLRGYLTPDIMKLLGVRVKSWVRNPEFRRLVHVKPKKGRT